MAEPAPESGGIALRTNLLIDALGLAEEPLGLLAPSVVAERQAGIL